MDTLVAIRNNEELDPEKRIKGAVPIMQLSGITREKPRKGKRATVPEAIPAKGAPLRRGGTAPAGHCVTETWKVWSE